jgi:uncharacterized protein DUF4350
LRSLPLRSWLSWARIRALLETLLVFTGLGLVSGEIRGLGPDTAHFVISVIALLLTLSWVARGRQEPHTWTLWLRIGCVVLLWATVALTRNQTLLLALYAAWAVACHALVPCPSDRSAAIGRGVVAAAVFLLLLRFVPALSFHLTLLARDVSSWVSMLWSGASLGASASGLTVLCFWSSVLIAVRQLPSRAHLRSVFILILGAFIAHTVIQGILVSPAMRILTKDTYFIIVGLAVLLPLSGACRRERAHSRARGYLWVVPLCLGIALFVLGALPALQRVELVEGEEILFIDDGMLGTWQTPADKPPGSAFTGASFGLLPMYAEAYGYRFQISDQISDATLRGQDVVVLINPGRPFSAEERSRILDFVERGGGLLAMGDHTDIGGIMQFFNELFVPVGIGLRFDSAVSIRRSWTNELDLARPFSGIFGADEVPISIGASVWSRASLFIEPLAVGLSAFSDPGDRSNTDSALLGNLEYNRGETYGEIPLAVTRHYGQGRIALFGDTSPFQNTSLAASNRFLAALLAWLTDGPSGGSAAARLLLALALAVTAPIGIGWMTSPRRTLIAIAAVAAGVVVTFALGPGCYSPSQPIGVPLGIVDLEHNSLVSRQALDPTALDALIVSLARNGYLPVLSTRHRPVVPHAEDIFVSVAGTAPFSRHEIAELLKAVEQGATLIIGTRWPLAASAQGLFHEIEIDIINTPLGKTRPVVSGASESPQFTSAWPLSIVPPWIPLATLELEGITFVVAAEREMGAGRIIIVGDTGIFSNASLEGRNYYYQENVDFLSHLLRREDLR